MGSDLRAAMVLFVLVTGFPAESRGQEWSVGGAVSANLMVAGASEFLEGGPGLDAQVSRRLRRNVSLRATGGLLFLKPQQNLGERAANTLIFLGAGPEFSVTASRLILSLTGLVGVAANVQSRSRSALAENNTTAWLVGAGLGLGTPLGTRVSLDTGIDLFSLGELEFARTRDSGRSAREAPVVMRARGGLRVLVH
jgi:hypothetical protein